MEFMISRLDEQKCGAVITIDDDLGADGTVQLFVESCPRLGGIGDGVHINREEAASLIAHLKSVFGI